MNKEHEIDSEMNDGNSLEKILQQHSNNKFLIWFILTNLAILLPFIIFWGEPAYAFLVIAIGFFASLLSLFLSKFLAIRAHKIIEINPQHFHDDVEKNLYNVVSLLSQKAGLEVIPAVGVYESPDMNAFATGYSQKSAIIAFSTTLLEGLAPHEIEAVAAHEIAHIVNQDMLGTTLIQGLINALVLLASLPFYAFGLFFRFFCSDGSWFAGIIEGFLYLCGIVAKLVLYAIGTLCSLAYSRHREYKADTLAAYLTSSDSMVSALATLSRDTCASPKSQSAYAAFKVKNLPSFLEILSTHPDINKRINVLKDLNQKEEQE